MNDSVLIRILTQKEFIDNITNSTLNDNIEPHSEKVWNNAENYDNTYFYYYSADGIYSCTVHYWVNLPVEMFQDNKKNKILYAFALKTTKDYGYDNKVINISHAAGGMYPIDLECLKDGMHLYITSEENTSMPICFRPVFNFIDNAKSTNLFY
jgi:hypothetical protein